MFQLDPLELLATTTLLIGDFLAVVAVGSALIALALRFLNQRDVKYLPLTIMTVGFGLVGYFARIRSTEIPPTTTNGILLPMSNTMMLLLFLAAVFFLVARAFVGRLSTS